MPRVLALLVFLLAAFPLRAQDAPAADTTEAACPVPGDLSALFGPVPGVSAPPTLDAPPLVLRGVPFRATVKADSIAGPFSVRVDGREYATSYDAEAGGFVSDSVLVTQGSATVEVVQAGAVLAQAPVRSIPGWLSILPPLLAIGMALVFRKVIPALFAGIWLGAWIVAGLSIGGLWWGLLNSFQVYVLQAFANEDHASIILFSLMIGGMVGIISRNGGTYGIVNHLVRYASNPKRGQVATSLLGIVIFFDDYANTLVVGNTMRPVTDRLRISREKLAYIVDSTAAPVACLAFVTTWIGYQVGLVGTAVEKLPTLNEAPYSIFLNSIPYSFYPIFAIFFLFVVALSKREFGPMYRAELRARSTGAVLGEGAKVDPAMAEGSELEPTPHRPQRAFNAIIPVLTLVVGVMAGLYYTGVEEAGAAASLRDIIGAANSYKALMWGSLLSVLVAALLSVGQRILTMDETVDAWYAGMKSMLLAMIILILAWSLSSVTEALRTADFLVSTLSGTLSPGMVPALIFLIAAATAFATGTSWGTMGILMPLVVPLAWGVLEADGLHTQAEYLHILYSTVSAVLAGAVWGDHCSPISDTTILSSMASGCDHIEHVRTQLPYALFVGVVALFVGTIPTGFNFPWWASMLLGFGVLAGVFFAVGKPVEGYNAPVEAVREV